MQYSDTADNRYGSINDGISFTHNNKLYLLTYESSGLRGPDIWYYRINANTGEVEQFKKTVFSNKNIGIVGNRFQFYNSCVDINPDTGDICGNSPQTDEKTFEVFIVNNVGSASTSLTIKVNLFSVGTWIFIIIIIIIVITGLSIVLYQFSHRPKQLPIYYSL